MKIVKFMLLAASVTAAVSSAVLAVENQKETFSITINDKLGRGEIYGEIITTVDHTKEEYEISKKLKIARRDSTGKEIWKVQDFVNECPLDTTLQLVRPINLTDFDENGLKEVWLVYKMACRGDVSPAKMKIIMYEGKNKYAMRGSMKLPIEAAEAMSPDDGAHTADENLKKSEFFDHAEYIWKHHEVESYDY
jgi:hypothetical protein